MGPEALLPHFDTPLFLGLLSASGEGGSVSKHYCDACGGVRWGFALHCPCLYASIN